MMLGNSSAQDVKERKRLRQVDKDIFHLAVECGFSPQKADKLVKEAK